LLLGLCAQEDDSQRSHGRREAEQNQNILRVRQPPWGSAQASALDQARRTAEAAAAHAAVGSLRLARGSRRKAAVAAAATATLRRADGVLSAHAAAVQLQLRTDELHEARRLLSLAQVHECALLAPPL
jgi:hypothetical protein